MKLMLLILSINQGKEKRASSKLSAVQPYGVHFKRDLFSWFSVLLNRKESPVHFGVAGKRRHLLATSV